MYLLEPFEGLLGELVVCAVLLEVLPEAWEDGLEVFEGSGHLCGGAGGFAAGNRDSPMRCDWPVCECRGGILSDR